MKLLFENWRKYINEEKNEDLESKIRKALEDEGGAAGMKALIKHTGATEEDIKAAMGDWEGVGEHPDGDYILQGGNIKILSEEKCWSGYAPGAQSGVKTKKGKGGKRVNNCEPLEEKEVTAEETRDKKPGEVQAKYRATFKQSLAEEEFYEVDAVDVNEEYCPVCKEAQRLEEKKRRKRRKSSKKRKKPCKKAKGKMSVKRVNGRCRSFGQAGRAKDGGRRIRPGTAKGDRYCARSAGIKKCKNPPCANTLSRKKWRCRGKKSMKA